MSRSKKIQRDLGNTKAKSQDSPAKKWFFTLKRGDIAWQEVYAKLDPISSDFVFSGEKGEKGGYRHYQGTMNLVKKLRFDPLRRLLYPEIHLEKQRHEQEALEYCMKADTHEDGPWGKGKYFQKKREDLITNYYPWQLERLEVWKGPAQPRIIEWIWSLEGNKGRSTFARDCFRKLKNIAITTAEKPNDIIMMAKEDIRIYIIDIPRASHVDPYIALEKLKNGFVVDCKLKKEGRVVDMWEIPHVIVFANFYPDKSKLSEDRWNIIEL